MAATTARFHTPDDVRDSIESLQQAHGSGRPVIYWLVLAIALVTIACLPLVKVEVSVGAPGQIRPRLERVAVVPAVEGYIQTLRVVDNQPVQRDDILLTLESATTDARLAQVRREAEQNANELADLRLLIERITTAIDHRPKGGEDRFAEFRQPMLATSLSAALRTTPYVRQLAVLLADVQRSLLQRDKARQELARSEALHAKRLISDLDFEQQRFTADAVDRDLELSLQQALSRWQADRRDHELKGDDVEAQLQQLKEQKALYVVRAPVAGAAVGFVGLHPGQFLPAGQHIGDISPGADLQADIYVGSRDIGFVHGGQHVSLQVDAFPYTEWGTLKGRVHDISQDFVQVGQQVAFKVVVDLDATQLHSADGATVNLRRGMTVNARFVLKRRTLFELLYGKMSDVLDPTAKSSTE